MDAVDWPKGQDSATADLGSVNKSGVENSFRALDLISFGLSWVWFYEKSAVIKLSWSSWSKPALSHKGLALIDVISCVTF